MFEHCCKARTIIMLMFPPRVAPRPDRFSVGRSVRPRVPPWAMPMTALHNPPTSGPLKPCIETIPCPHCHPYKQVVKPRGRRPRHDAPRYGMGRGWGARALRACGYGCAFMS